MDLSRVLHEAVEESKEGCIIHLKVRMGKRNVFPAGIDKWRKRVEIEINEKPEGGRANQAILQIMRRFFKSNAEIVYGRKSREKGIFIGERKEKIIEMIEDGL